MEATCFVWYVAVWLSFTNRQILFYILTTQNIQHANSIFFFFFVLSFLLRFSSSHFEGIRIHVWRPCTQERTHGIYGRMLVVCSRMGMCQDVLVQINWLTRSLESGLWIYGMHNTTNSKCLTSLFFLLGGTWGYWVAAKSILLLFEADDHERIWKCMLVSPYSAENYMHSILCANEKKLVNYFSVAYNFIFHSNSEWQMGEITKMKEENLQ